jgi:hypothetical protein
VRQRTSLGRPCALLASAALLANVVACSAGGDPSTQPRAGGAGSDVGSSGASGSLASAGSGNMSGTGAAPSSIGIATLLESCSASKLGRPQVRRLTRGELQRTLDDIFPQVKGKWTVSIAEAESSLGFDNDPAVLTVGSQVAGKLLDTASALATAHRIALALRPSSTNSGGACSAVR